MADNRRKEKAKTYHRGNSSYIYGNTVRKMQTQPVRREEREIRRQEPQKKRISKTTRRNRRKAKSINLFYVIFLAGAASLFVLTCANLIQLQTNITTTRSEVSSLKSQISELKTVNDDTYNKLISSVNLEEIKRVALEELGMVYSNKNQVIIYEGQDSDYVRQYKDVE